VGISGNGLMRRPSEGKIIEIKPIRLNPQMLNLISEIDRFQCIWVEIKELHPERLAQLRKVATIESIGSSTRIEGSRLSDKEVEKLLLNIEIQSFRSRDEEEIAGYAEGIEEIFQSYDTIPLTENYIKQLHSILLKYSSKDVRHRGKYKKFPNHVEAFNNQGKSVGIVFETAKPFDTPFLMKEIIHWTNEALLKKTLHPLVVVGIFIVWFLAIHPFQDGNGRLSRVLTILLLLRLGYSYVPYSSLESIIEENKKNYYLALRRTQATLNKSNPNWTSWLRFFLSVLKKQKDNLNRKLKKDSVLIGKLNPLELEIMNHVKSYSQVTISQLENLTKINRNTLKSLLRGLVKKKYLILCGKGRSAWYVLDLPTMD